MCGQPFALLLFLLLSLISPIKRKSIPQFSSDTKPVFFLISSFQAEVGTTGLEESYGRTMLLKCALQYLPLMRLVWGENFKRSRADGSLSYIPRFFFFRCCSHYRRSEKVTVAWPPSPAHRQPRPSILAVRVPAMAEQIVSALMSGRVDLLVTCTRRPYTHSPRGVTILFLSATHTPENMV